MEAKIIDEKTGEEKHYEISYSQELQQKTVDILKTSNRLKIALLIGLGLVIIVGILVVTKTGTVGEIIRAGFCQ